MIDPKELVKEGITVYKANQRPREYVCTFLKVFFINIKGISCWIFAWI